MENIKLFYEVGDENDLEFGFQISKLKEFLDAARITNELREEKDGSTPVVALYVPADEVISAAMNGVLFIVDQGLVNIKEYSTDSAPYFFTEDVERYNRGVKDLFPDNMEDYISLEDLDRSGK